MPASRRKRKITQFTHDAEDMAIKAHHNLVSLGYGEEIEPLRLPNRRGKIAIFLAAISAVFYGIGGFIFGMNANSSFESSGFFFHFLDNLTIISIITAGASVCFALLGFCKKYSSRLPSIISFIVLLTAPLVLHILGVTFGLMMP